MSSTGSIKERSTSSFWQATRYAWEEADGSRNFITQAEGGEQGDPLMPALYALAQHDALVAADNQLLPDESLFSFLDDLYVTTCQARAREVFDVVSSSVQQHAGVQTHLGKLKA